MTRRGTGNRQKKIVAPRGVRGGQKSLRVTAPRPSPPPPTRRTPEDDRRRDG